MKKGFGTEELVVHLQAAGWRKWGLFTKKKGSSYQCFRRGNRYIWIGYQYIEHPDQAEALDYKTTSKTALNRYMGEKIVK